MKVPFKIIKIINIIALLFLLAGGYGLPFTGALQVLAAVLFLITFPRNKLIYIYFCLVILFFLIWDQHTIDWLFLLPIFLVFFLTYTIRNKKRKLKTENKITTKDY
ncbi:hypothetical protein [Flavobacterium sp.]|uniref:hypothetical protein n=1 Tax=Flavobacterium sp. TaxID=239 RepID=UPI0032638B20